MDVDASNIPTNLSATDIDATNITAKISAMDIDATNIHAKISSMDIDHTDKTRTFVICIVQIIANVELSTS
ncbi:hypothetical protein DPMN_137589 [Dreissena polymorpha]|uniref:Uncharacterized protein n=1 Tax=Dreissena polymorpha TaxID=45954 RepID=A0A9D4G282_DREPO|nr:hypothetical protein DPMN_137589 [Dreissena polymorpha]